MEDYYFILRKTVVRAIDNKDRRQVEQLLMKTDIRDVTKYFIVYARDVTKYFIVYASDVTKYFIVYARDVTKYFIFSAYKIILNNSEPDETFFKINLICVRFF